MKNEKFFRIGLAFVEVLILLICIYQIVIVKKIEHNFSYDALESEEGLYMDSFEGVGGCYIDNSMESRENCIRTVPILLEKGSYEIMIQYSVGSDDQSYSFTSQNATYRVIGGRERCALPSKRKLLTLHVSYGESVNGFQIMFNYSGNGYLVVHNVEIIRTRERERIQFFAALFIIFIAECIYWGIRKEIWKSSSIRQKNMFLFICCLIFFCSYPVFSPYLYKGHDLNFHLMRIEGIKDGLLAGEFPVRLQPSWLGGNGYAVSVFYGDLFLYFPALLRILGFSITFSYNAYLIMINIITALIFYYCAKGYSQSRYIGFLGATVYTLSPYRLSCVFVRASVGEFTALAFIPLIFYGLYCIAFEELEKKKINKGWLLLVLGFTGIIQSHLITSEIIAIFFGIFCLLLWKRLFVKERMFALLKAAACSVTVNAAFLIPFIHYMKIGGIRVTEENRHTYIQTEGIFGSQLFSFFPHAYGMTYGITEGTKFEEMFLGIGLPYLIGILLCLLYYINGKKEDRPEYKRNVVVLLISVVLIFMSTFYFPWDWLLGKGRLAELMVGNIQFPWRLLGIISFFLSFIICSLLIMIYRDGEKFGKKIALLIGMTAVIVGGYFMSSLVTVNNTLAIKDESQLNDYEIIGAEYLPTAVNAFTLPADEVIHGEAVKMLDYKKNGTTVMVDIINQSEVSQNITVPLVYYYGYEAEDMNTGTEFQVFSGDNGRVTYTIPGLYTGVVKIKFKEPLIWRIAEFISLAGCLWIAFDCLKKVNRKF